MSVVFYDYEYTIEPGAIPTPPDKFYRVARIWKTATPTDITDVSYTVPTADYDITSMVEQTILGWMQPPPPPLTPADGTLASATETINSIVNKLGGI